MTGRLSYLMFAGFAGFAALAIAGCAEPAPAPAAAQSSSAEAEAPSDSAAVASSAPAAASGDQLAVLSGDKPIPLEPPPAPSAQPPSVSSARVAQLNNELAELDIAMLSALSSRDNVTDKTTNGGGPPYGLLDSPAPGKGGVGDLSAGGGGGAYTPGAGGVATIGSRSDGGITGAPGSTIGGKSAKDLTTEDIDKALGRAGCTTTRLDSPSQPPSPGAIFGAKCPSGSFVVSFVPAGGTLPDAKTISEMESRGTTWKEGGMLLAVVPSAEGAREAAIELMNKLRTPMVSGPKGNAAVGGASVSGGSVGNAGAVVAGMAAGFRRCYARGLKEDANMKGSVRVTAKIGPNGEVQSASPSGGGGLSSTVTSCVASVVSSRTFDKPDGGSATIVIPVSFFPQ